ncbi:MAG: hypothetical protein MUP63_02765 [Candidatus Nanohaloarchaeota archaeon QJJ-7]|nr:hypothetical protein [Candidatus Nanohaloarchaeota archaeon QJJ-7]
MEDIRIRYDRDPTVSERGLHVEVYRREGSWVLEGRSDPSLVDRNVNQAKGEEYSKEMDVGRSWEESIEDFSGQDGYVGPVKRFERLMVEEEGEMETMVVEEDLTPEAREIVSEIEEAISG